MKKNDLLGRGITILSTEGSDRDMLRMLLASDVVRRTVPNAKAKAAVTLTEHQRANQERIRKENEDCARECRWIGERLTADIVALGAGPVLLKVSEQHGAFTVRMLQWQANRMGIEVDHVFKPNRQGYGVAFEEAKLGKQTSARFAKLLQNQAESARELGTPRPIAPEEITLTRYTIEKPFAAMMSHAFGQDAGPLLRSAMAANRKEIVHEARWSEDKRLEQAGFVDHEVSWARDTIRGAFSTGEGDVSLTWSKGSLAIFGVDLPDSVWMGCTGQRLGSLIGHPLFDGDMLITAVHATREKGVANNQARQGWTLTLKDTSGPIPTDW